MTAPFKKSSSDEEVGSTRVHDHETLGSCKEGGESAANDLTTPLTEEELALEKKLRFKLDITIMPLMIWTYLMNYIDR